MHHHLFPTEDTYITNQSGFESKNFGINEILHIGTQEASVQVKETTKPYSYVDVLWTNHCVTDFTGTLTGSFIGAAVTAYGWVVCSASFSSSYFSGSVNGGVNTEISGWISGYVSGLNTGSLLSVSMSNFSGSLTSSYGHITGTVTGIDTINEIWYNTTSTKNSDRTFIKFDLDGISESMVRGEIVAPQFRLNLKVCNEYQLPMSYSIYAFPISQSWTMGNGYWSDGGSVTGASWYYKNQSGGSPWYAPITSSVRPVVDFLNDSGSATGSFAYGGGTWYYADSLGTSSVATQDFAYESADISMDVTDIVMAWIDGTLPNNGFILLSSDEVSNSGSGFSLTFYGKDTNSVNSPYLDISWSDWVWETGISETGSVVITSSYSGMQVTVQTGSTFSFTGGIHGTFSASLLFTGIYPVDSITSSFLGIALGAGNGGNIQGLPVVGPVSGTISVSQSLVTGPCGASFSASLVTASFTDGVWSGSQFTSYYVDYKLENSQLTGSWSANTLMGSTVTIPIPSGIDPYAYAYVAGPYVNGKAFGSYQVSGSTSASFFGTFIEGPFIGGYLSVQLSGSVSTSSYSYTSSVEITSSAFNPLDTNQSFTVIVKDLKPTYKGGDLARVKIFGRKEFPLKTFGKTSQQLGYIVPELLPTSSFYAIKDNMSEEMIVDFDNYTRISCEYPYGNFFMLDTTGLAQERPYRILIRVENSGSRYTFDDGNVFKITR